MCDTRRVDEKRSHSIPITPKNLRLEEGARRIGGAVSERQFLWGLSIGITVLGIAGTFWLGLGIGLHAAKLGGRLCALLTVVQAGGCVALVWAALCIRRKSGFHTSELRGGDGRLKAEARRMLAGFCWTTAGQAALIASSVWWCLRTHAEQMIWPAIGLVVSLHRLICFFQIRWHMLGGDASTWRRDSISGRVA